MSLIQADARAIPLADGSVQMVCTSPPYFGLRDYGMAGQIGLEATPDAYVAVLVAVFREVRRVLADDGVCWLNLGDSYAGSWGARGRGPETNAPRPDLEAKYGTEAPNRRTWRPNPSSNDRNGAHTNRNGLTAVEGCKSKDLIGIPWRVAFALQADGWYLRSDIIWSKPNPMPESVTDRPTKAHEYLFLLSKCERYFYDADAIAEAGTGRETFFPATPQLRALQATGMRNDGNSVNLTPALTRNKRSVWTIPTMPYAGAHFATMPEALVEPCILAGSRLGDRVLDPFVGSGTVGAVAERLGRRWVGVDLNPAYHHLAKVRTAQRGIPFTEAS